MELLCSTYHEQSLLHMILFSMSIYLVPDTLINHQFTEYKPFVMAQITINGLVHFLLFLSMVALASAQSSQCPNDLAVYNPNLRTACVTGSTLPCPESLFSLYAP